VYVKCTNVINVICGLGRAFIILISSSIEIYGSHLCVVSACITEDEDGELIATRHSLDFLWEWKYVAYLNRNVNLLDEHVSPFIRRSRRKLRERRRNDGQRAAVRKERERQMRTRTGRGDRVDREWLAQ